MPIDAADFKKYFMRLDFADLKRDHPSIEHVIADAEATFRDEELEHDWSGQPIPMDRVSQGQPVSPVPPYWKASVDYAASIAVALVRK